MRVFCYSVTTPTEKKDGGGRGGAGEREDSNSGRVEGYVVQF